MITVKEALGVLQSHVSSKKVTLRDLQEILSHVMGQSRSDLFFQQDVPILQTDLDSACLLAKEKEKGVPLARVLGFVDFYGVKIGLTKDVLIPRPETEILLDKAVARCLKKNVVTVIDLCTGSGCLGIAFKKKFPEAEVYLGDLSKKALEVASKNAKMNHVNVSFIHSNLLQDFQKNLKADLVFCNPPYISKKEYERLDESVKLHDPIEALVAEDEGLSFYKRLAKELPPYLSKGALVALEIGYLQKSAVQEIFNGPFWKEIICEKDFSGHDRFIFLECE